MLKRNSNKAISLLSTSNGKHNSSKQNREIILPQPWRVLFSLLVLSFSSFPRSDFSLPMNGKKFKEMFKCCFVVVSALGHT